MITPKSRTFLALTLTKLLITQVLGPHTTLDKNVLHSNVAHEQLSGKWCYQKYVDYRYNAHINFIFTIVSLYS